jgi:dTMP kinase
VSGRFIAFEGGEASGKSTQAARLAHSLGAILTREPGGTTFGERVRHLLLDPSVTGLDDRAEALLMAAARAQHVTELIRPALAAGHDVVSDRFSGSSLAYQGYGRGLVLDDVRRLSEWAAGGVWPDLVVLLDVDPSVAQARRRGLGGHVDRLEAAGDEFHRRVVEGFRSLAAADPTWIAVDGGGTIDEVGARVAAAVDAFFKQ